MTKGIQTESQLRVELNDAKLDLRIARDCYRSCNQLKELYQSRAQILERAADIALSSFHTRARKISVDGTATMMYNVLKQALEQIDE